MAAPFSLRLDPETRARLEAEARRLDRPAAQVAARAIVRWLDAERHVVWAIDRNDDGRIAPVLPSEKRPNPHSRYSGQG